MTLRPESFTAVITSHANPDGLRRMLGNLMYQTRTPDEIIVLASDTPELDGIAEEFVDVLVDRGIESRWLPEENRDDWGHEKRGRGLMLARGEYVGFFNDDDSYTSDYLETMLGTAEHTGADAVYCDWTGVPNCDFRAGSSTSGNFIVRTELAQATGYPDRHYEADGTFITAFRRQSPVLRKVSRVLYFHNREVPC